MRVGNAAAQRAARPLRVCFVTTGLTLGGAETALTRLAIGLDRERFTPSVVSLMGDGHFVPRLVSAGVPVTTVGFADRIPTPPRIVRLVRAIRRSRPDVVMGWMYHGNLAASLARALGVGDPALAWNIRHSVYDLASERGITRNLIRIGAPLSRHVDATVYVGTVSRDLHLRLGYDARTAQVIGNGLDAPEVASPEAMAEVRAELGLTSSDTVVGHVARFHPMKDHAGFLRAMDVVASTDPTVKVLLVGRDATADNPVLRHLLDVPSLRGRVITLGERADVTRLLGAMDIFCLSSTSEGSPNVVLEAMAVGLPSVVTDVGAAAEIAGPDALVVRPRDPQALADAVLTLCRAGREARVARGEALRQRALDHYSLGPVVDAYSTLFTDLVGRRAVHAAAARGIEP